MTESGNRRRTGYRRRGLVFALLAVFCLAAGPAGSEEVITAGSEYDYPPFCFVNAAGQTDGFSVELFRAALKTMGRKVEFQTGYWSDLKAMLVSGEINALPLVGRTPEREPFFDFTFPYLSLHGAIVVRKDNREIRTLEDLRGRRVVVMAGDNSEEFLRRTERGIEIRTAPTFAEALRELSAGQHDAVFIQRLVAIRLLQQTGIGNLKILPNPVEDFRQDFSFAVRNGDSETLALLNEGLALVMADGTFQRLHARWFAALELPRRVIVVGGDHNYPPYEFLDGDGLPAGFSVELTRAVAAAGGLEVEIRLGPWTEIRRELAEGGIDAIQGILYSPKRARDFDFSPSYLVNHYVAVVRAEAGEPPATTQELAGLRIVVQRGDIMDDYISQQGVEAEITRVDSQEEALRELAGGRHDCALAARLTTLHLIEKHGWENLKTGKQPLLSPEYCYAVPKGKKAFLAQITEGLRVVLGSGEYRRLRDKWMGIYEEPEVSWRNILRYSAVILLPLLLILAAILLWSWSLRREVKRRTADLALSERRYRNLFERAPLGVFTSHSSGQLISVNPALASIFGYTGTGEMMEKCRDLARDTYFYPEQRAELLRQLEGTGWVNNFELEARKADGSKCCLSLNARIAERDRRGGYVIEGFLTDITARKTAEIERERLITAIEQAGEAILITDSRGIIRYANPAFEAMTGYTRPEALGRSPRRLKNQEQNPKFYHQILKTIRGGRTWRGRIVNRRKNGELFTAEVAVSPVRGSDGKINNYVAALADITRELNLEEQYRQAHKMEAVGQLAGGIAHDFNNILQAILGYGQLLRDGLDDGGREREFLDEILKAGERAATLTQQLLAFSRRQVIRLEPIDLNRVIEHLLKMLRRLIGEDIRLEFIPGSRLGTVPGDVNMLEQVLVDLAINARDAMPGGGVLTIETRNVLIDSDYCAVHPGPAPGRYALLSVTDCGHGMDQQTLSHIFEPFFTTKPEGKGTGLGLAMVYGIVSQHNGIIRAYSEPGRGTAFKIYLPICEEKAAEIGNLIAGAAVGGDEKILLAEDDPMVRNLTVRILEQAGYTVLTAADGAEAVEVYRRRAQEVDLLILDMVMPRRSGYKAWQAIRKNRPDIPVLFTSGYSENAVHTNFILKQGLRLIQKPYLPDALLRAVRDILDNDRDETGGGQSS